jgi:putative oxidoreductase
MPSPPGMNVAPLIGRILIAIFFIPSGLGKIAGFSGTVGYIASAGLPTPSLGAVIAIIVEVLVAASLLVGWQARWSALILAAFAIAASLSFHKYWAVPADQRMMQHNNFFKNMAIAGGLLFVYAFGPGVYSLDV